MNEVAFPLLGAAFVLVLALPASALCAKLLLVLAERGEAAPLHGFQLRYLLLTGSSALPLAWLLSAAVHQGETGQTVLACLFEHASELCAEPRLFAAVLLLAVALCCAPVLLRRRNALPRSANPLPRSANPLPRSANPLPRVRRAAPLGWERTLHSRIEQLLARHAELAPLLGRVQLTDAPNVALEARGWLRPRVLLGAEYAQALSDDELAGALAHEAEHVRAWDPLRYLLLELALAANPCGRWLLRPHARRWLIAREAHCDRDAVLRGASPLSLAQAIVHAARPPQHAVALGAPDMEVLQLRIGLLLAFAERRPARCSCRRSAFAAAALLLGLALSLPHGTGTGALDALHSHSERALLYALP